MTVINTNVKALFTQSALKVAARDGQIAMEQLSTGKRINNSKDDAAGLAIAARMTQNIQGLNQSIRNAGDAISMIQTAEGATQEITVMLQRMSELAVQSANSTYSSDQRSYLDQEFQQLKQEIIRVSEMHEWNGFPILNGKAGTPVGTPTTSSLTRAGVADNGKQLMTGDLAIQTDKGSFAIPASLASTDAKSNTIAAGSNNAGSAIAIAAAINSQVGVTGVSAVAGAATIGATKTTVGSTSIQTDLYVNGEKVSLSLSASHTLGQRRQYVMESINAGTTVHGVVAGDSGTGGLTLTTPDGRNLSVWYDSTSVQGSDFGLGLDTTPPTNPPGVTGIAGSAATAFGSPKTTTVDFPILPAGKKFTLNGLTFTAGTAGTTAAQTAAAFANLKSGMSAVAAAAANSASTGLGSFSGTFAEGFTTGAVSSTAVTATATSKGNVGNILVNPGVPTYVKTEGTSSVTEKNDITFKPLLAGESVEINGLKFTATYNLSDAEVATAFANIAANTAASAVTSSKSATSALLGTYTGTFATGWATGSITGTNVVTATSTITLPTVAVTTTGASGTPQVATVTFNPLAAGQTITLAGLTFVAGSGGASVDQLKAVFDVPTAGQGFADVNTALNALSGNPLPSTVGRFTAGTMAAGTFNNSGVFTATTGDSTQINLNPTAVNSDTADIAISGNPQSATALQISSVTPVAASTVYGTVTLNSNTTFTVKPGAKANPTNTPAADPTYANFTALGFEAKTINPKNIGRLSFQVGPAANQLISIDLADFGKNGDITGPITSDLAPTTLLTVNSANNVIMNVNKSLDRIAATRATMGAVMNRLEHVIDNLTNVVMNSEASRSQIEDADYAQASTELARTQIMQQAATAVLAQANSSQQTVLKLLQG
jgi:flagellin